MADPRVTFTNNQAEWILRMVKPRMKTSGSFHTRARAEYFAHVRCLGGPARKQAHDLFRPQVVDRLAAHHG